MVFLIWKCLIQRVFQILKLYFTGCFECLYVGILANFWRSLNPFQVFCEHSCKSYPTHYKGKSHFFNFLGNYNYVLKYFQWIQNISLSVRPCSISVFNKKCHMWSDEKYKYHMTSKWCHTVFVLQKTYSVHYYSKQCLNFIKIFSTFIPENHTGKRNLGYFCILKSYSKMIFVISCINVWISWFLLTGFERYISCGITIVIN